MDRSQRTSRDRDAGIFAKLNVKFNPKGTVTHLNVQNQIMLICTNGQTLQMIKLQRNEESSIPLSLALHDRISAVHLDPTGRHALISSSMGDNYYLSTKTKAVKSLKRLKNHEITAVGWNLELSKDTDTSFIVLGTSKGILMETSINASGNMSYLKTLTSDLVKGKNACEVTSLHLSPCSEYSSEAEARWMLLVCVPSQLFCLAGVINPIARESTAQQVVGTMFSATMLDQTVATLQALFKEKPRSLSVSSKQENLPSTVVVYPVGKNEIPNKFVWLNSSGIAFGTLDPSGGDPSSSDALDIVHEEVSVPHKMIDGRLDLPMDVALTEHHALLLYPDRFVALSLLNQKVMHEELLTNESLHIVGMTRDSASQFIWIYTESSILKYRPVDETRFIWKIYLDRGEYSKAIKMTHAMEDARPHQLVLKKLADKQIAEKNYEAAARTLISSAESFESILLKFTSAGSAGRNGLKLLLELKLKEMDIVTSEDKKRRDLLICWLVQLFLSEMAEARRVGLDAAPLDSPERHPEKNVRQLRDQLFVFLNNRAFREAVEVNKKQIYELMLKHADHESQLELAKSLKDHTKVIDTHIHLQNYEAALEVVSVQEDPELFYQYSPLLFPHIPKKMFSAWTKNEKISPAKLLPTLYKCHASEEMRNAAMYYIKWALSKAKKEKSVVDKQMQNFFISLLANYKPEQLLPYFESYGKLRREVPYDVEFALRICLEKDAEKTVDLSRCCVFLYCVAEMFEQAVDRALPIDLNLAKQCVKMMDERSDAEINSFILPFSDFEDRPQKYSTEMKRRIWLKIARYVITEQKDVEACMNLLKESNNILKIQDLLPHFPQFTKIEHFKEPLCASLKDHSAKIQELQREMREAAEVANEIRGDMEKLKTKFTIIKPADKCEKCKEKALTRPFFAFACKHFYHRDCLEKAIQPTFTQEEKDSYNVIKGGLERCRHPQRAADLNNKEFEEWATLNKKLEQLLSSSCILCGPKMIKSAVRPLLTEEEYDRELETW
uniref:Vacuolar protein sorting-associated protein 18 homolog n=1 Tax=Steinernema glaseri TaxID=37863 RepID=A0A1I8AWU2_9BILA